VSNVVASANKWQLFKYGHHRPGKSETAESTHIGRFAALILNGAHRRVQRSPGRPRGAAQTDPKQTFMGSPAHGGVAGSGHSDRTSADAVFIRHNAEARLK
jgi:hypothetical protein